MINIIRHCRLYHIKNASIVCVPGPGLYFHQYFFTLVMRIAGMIWQL